MHAIDELGSLELDDALVALGVGPLIDGEGEIARAQEARHGTLEAVPGARFASARTQPVLVEAGIAAHVALARDVGHQEADGPVALGLEGEDAVIFEGTGEGCGEGEALAEEGGDLLGIGVAREHVVDQRTEPHETAADGLRLELEGLDEIVGGIRACGRAWG